MKKLAILAMGLSMLLCSCGNSPLYKGLTDKKYTYTDNSGNTQTYIFHEDNLLCTIMIGKTSKCSPLLGQKKKSILRLKMKSKNTSLSIIITPIVIAATA